MKIENLVKPSTLAKKLGLSTRWINSQIQTGKLASILIDGERFIDSTGPMPIPGRPGRKTAGPNG